MKYDKIIKSVQSITLLIIFYGTFICEKIGFSLKLVRKKIKKAFLLMKD